MVNGWKKRKLIHREKKRRDERRRNDSERKVFGFTGISVFLHYLYL